MIEKAEVTALLQQLTAIKSEYFHEDEIMAFARDWLCRQELPAQLHEYHDAKVTDFHGKNVIAVIDGGRPGPVICLNGHLDTVQLCGGWTRDPYGELDGDKITVDTVDNLGYGYMGISAVAVNVGGDPGSDASKDLRKGLATVFAAYRELSVESYYGERATVINYPISNTSWAAPQPTDAGYQVAFSVDVDGNPIYTSGMSADDKYAAAKAAALGFFEAAGYTVENGKITAAPEGAKMQYEVQIPADGTGNHPAFMMVTEAKKALAEIGMDIVVTDLSDATALWDGIRARQVDMWCAAWSATPDPDMYQVYYADVADFNGDMGNGFNPQGGPDQGNSSYMYCVADEELDNMIMEARKSLDQSYRKTLYKACLDTIVDWATEVPVYQRQNAIIFSTERVKMETVLPDITTFYGWLNGIENMELN